MATMEDLAKRLSFGDATVHTPDGGLARARDVLAAVTAGTPPLSAAADQDAAQEDPEERDAAALRRALRERYDRPRARVSEMVARCAAAHAAGELVADSFAAHELESSRAALKRDFIELSTQQEVLSLLLGAKGGMPSVVADVQLGSVEDLEAALAEHKAAKKEAKSAARAALERAQGLVDEVASAHEEYEEERSALMQAIDALEAAQREREAAEAAMPSPQPAEVVASVERIAADASEAEAEARALAAAISADEEEIASLEADLLPLEEELGDLRATIDAEEAAAATEEQLGAKKARSREMHAWYSQMAQLVANLGGATLVRDEGDEETSDVLRLQITTYVKDGQVPLNHELTLAFAPGTTELAGASLSPADTPIDDLVEAAKTDAHPLAFILREVKAKLAGC